MNLSEEQIFALAPDESSKKSGKDLANPSKWVSRSVNEIALWGECQGSGSKPYQTQIDLTNIAFKCSCPSRKFPCKHGLGLLLLYAKNKDGFTTVAEPPAWVTDWLGKRSEKQEKQAAAKDKPVDEAAQAKRQQARQQKVEDGIEELSKWIKDIIRNGIIHIPEKDSSYFENVARRMVDAQAPGLANMVRSLGETNFFREGWQTAFTDQLVKIYLVLTGYRNKDLLNETLREDIKTLIGFTQSQEELKSQTGIDDVWLVLARQSEEQDAVTTEKYWLFGTQTKKYALVLQFIVRGQGMQYSLTPGMFTRAELVFFPSASPLRAIIKQQSASTVNERFEGFDNWNAVAAANADYNSIQPFQYERPFIVSKLKPVQKDDHWWLQDDQKKIVKINDGFAATWKLLALSGGKALTMAVIGKEDTYEPLGVWTNNEYKIL